MVQQLKRCFVYERL